MITYKGLIWVRMEENSCNNTLMTLEVVGAEAAIHIPDKHLPISSSSCQQPSRDMTPHTHDRTIMTLPAIA